MLDNIATKTNFVWKALYNFSLQEFVTNPTVMVKKLWEKQKDLKVPAVIYGRTHEKDAVLDFETRFSKIQKCGLYIHRKFSFFGASPDGIWRNSLIEIKCPYVLRYIRL